jgi:hypothetical protein
VLTQYANLHERVKEAADKRRLSVASYIGMVLSEHLASDSMEDVDRQLWELARLAEMRPPPPAEPAT